MKVKYLEAKISDNLSMYGCILMFKDGNGFLIEHSDGILKSYPYYWKSKQEAKEETLKAYDNWKN